MSKANSNSKQGKNDPMWGYHHSQSTDNQNVDGNEEYLLSPDSVSQESKNNTASHLSDVIHGLDHRLQD